MDSGESTLKMAMEFYKIKKPVIVIQVDGKKTKRVVLVVSKLLHLFIKAILLAIKKKDLEFTSKMESGIRSLGLMTKCMAQEKR